MKQIPLTQGSIALVDDEDYERISVHSWQVVKNAALGKKYAVRRVKTETGHKMIRMHRAIIGDVPEGYEVDHKDGDGLNNQKENLRICTHSDNLKNRTPRGTSKYMGVNLHQGRNWIARINIDGKQKHLGCFGDEVEAAKAYDTAAIATGNKHYRLNFPDGFPEKPTKDLSKTEELKQMLQETDALIAEGRDYLRSKGINYELSKWLTPKRYADKYGLSSPNIVTNWVARGIIPPEDVQVFEDLNNLKLIRDREYKSTPE